MARRKTKKKTRAVKGSDPVLYARVIKTGWSMKTAGGKTLGRVKSNADGSYTAFKGSKKISDHRLARKAKAAVRIATGTRAPRHQSNVGNAAKTMKKYQG